MAPAHRVQLALTSRCEDFDGRHDFTVDKCGERPERVADEWQRHLLNLASEVGKLCGSRGDGGGDLGSTGPKAASDTQPTRIGWPAILLLSGSAFRAWMA